MIVDSRGIVITGEVDLDYLRDFEPKHFTDYIKFVVDLETREVAIGMQLHASNLLSGNKEYHRGGNIFFEDGHIEYESTLNQKVNLELRKNKNHKDYRVNPRIITDQSVINEINTILFKLVKL
jgi:hypothetical protein